MHNELLGEFKQLSYSEQLQVVRDLIEKRDTPISRSYGALSVNTKLGFWYLLAEHMGHDIVPVPETSRLPDGARLLLTQIQQGHFAQTASLFVASGQLIPPFDTPVVGPEAIRAYLQQEAAGMQIQVHRLLSVPRNKGYEFALEISAGCDCILPIN